MDTAELQNAGVLAVSGVCRAAYQSGKRGCKTVANEGSMKTRICEEVLSYRCGDCRHITDVLHHGSKSDRSHYHDGGNVKFAELERRKSYPGCRCDCGEIQDGAAVRIGHSEEVHHQSYCIGDHNAHEDRNDLEHAFSPDVENDDCSKSNQGNEPVGGRIGDC